MLAEHSIKYEKVAPSGKFLIRPISRVGCLRRSIRINIAVRKVRYLLLGDRIGPSRNWDGDDEGL